MENRSEAERWMKDASDCFARAQRCFREEDWRGTVQNAQLAIELSTKAMIAVFEEPDWTHNPGTQLRMIVDDRRKELEAKFGPSFVDELIHVAEDSEFAAPWHGWSTYGREREDGLGWISAVDLCTVEVAEELLKRARRVFSTVEKFLRNLWTNG